MKTPLRSEERGSVPRGDLLVMVNFRTNPLSSLLTWVFIQNQAFYTKCALTFKRLFLNGILVWSTPQSQPFSINIP